MPDNSTTFRSRAALYAAIDGRIGAQTRFFLAASYTNWILHLLFFKTQWLTSQARLRFRLSATTEGFLAALSHRLESINIAHARLIENRALAGFSDAHGSLDAYMVRMEQAAVQRDIDGLKMHEPVTYARLVAELDRLLLPEQLPGYLIRTCRSAAAYDEVLRTLRCRLGRPMTFARRHDRQSIGLALIDAIRAA